jgi:hypothetical protein
VFTFEQARAAAELRISEMMKSSGIPISIVDRATLEKSWCWVFFYQSREALEIGDAKRLVGNGPLVVEKDGGRMYFLGTGRPVETQLEELRAKLLGSGPSR